MRTIQDMIQMEVLCCMSSMVSTLANGGVSFASRKDNAALAELCEQAIELASPVPDYKEAAIQAGYDGSRGGEEEWCIASDIDPYDREVFEHWAVTDWFADKLIEAGEKVDKDFAGLCVWARTTTGQAIYADGVIERIYAETHKRD